MAVPVRPPALSFALSRIVWIASQAGPPAAALAFARISLGLPARAVLARNKLATTATASFGCIGTPLISFYVGQPREVRKGERGASLALAAERWSSWTRASAHSGFVVTPSKRGFPLSTTCTV